MQPDARARSFAGLAWSLAALTTLVIFALAFSWILVLPSAQWSLFWGGHGFRRPSEGDQHPIHPGMLDKVLNETLGFGKILVINVPSANEKRRTLQEAAEASNLQLNWIEGVDPQDINKETLPPAKDGAPHSDLRGYSLGAWKAHMNALDSIIEAGISTAVVAEDDIDWDVRIKSQLKSSAVAFQALTQPLRYADVRPGALDYDDLPPFEPAEISPYGDGWDVLWLGHCRMHVEDRDQAYPMVVRRGDMTVAPKRHIQVSDIDDQETFLDNFPAHTRVYHHLRDGLCTLVYAVSYEGARKIRHEIGDVMLNGPFDVMLMQYCNLEARPGVGDKQRLKCLSVLPQLFNHWLPGPNTSRNIRWSTRKNLQQLRDNGDIVAEEAPAHNWIDNWED